MSSDEGLYELYSLTEDLEKILRKRFGLSIEDFLSSEVSKRYLDYCLEIIKTYMLLSGETSSLKRSSDIDRFIVPHLILVLTGSFEETDFRNMIIERELSRILSILRSLRIRGGKEILNEYLIDLANRIGLEAKLSDKQIVVYRSVDKRGKLRVDIYDVKIDLFNYLRILAHYRLSEKYDLGKQPVLGGFVYIKIHEDDPDKTSLLNILRDIFRERMRELAKAYSVYKDHPIVKEYVSRIVELRNEYIKRRSDLSIIRLRNRIEILKKYSAGWREELFPECIRRLLDKLRGDEKLSGEELYLLSTFLAYSNISIDEITENIPEERFFLLNIIKRIRESFNEEIYYPPPPCVYIKKIMRIEDSECSSKDPLGEYVRKLREVIKRSRRKGTEES